MKPFNESRPAPVESAFEARQAVKRKIYRALEEDDLDLAEKLLHELRALLEAPTATQDQQTEEEMEAERQEALKLLEKVAEQAHAVEFHYAARKINVPTGAEDKHGKN